MQNENYYVKFSVKSHVKTTPVKKWVANNGLIAEQLYAVIILTNLDFTICNYKEIYYKERYCHYCRQAVYKVTGPHHV